MKKIIFFMICFQCTGFNYALAADFSIKYTKIYIDGEIKQGDYERFRKIITDAFIEQTVFNNIAIYSIENKDREIILDGKIVEDFSDEEDKNIELVRSAFDGKLLPKLFNLKTVNLNSPGGSVLESMLIGESIHKSLLSTEINTNIFNNDHSCQSSCFLVWASGVERIADTRMRPPALREAIGELQVNDLGVHRVFFDPSEYSNYSGLQAISEYSSVKKVVSDFLLSMNIDKAIVEKMWKFSSTEMYFLSGSEKKSIVGITPFYEELLLSKCGSYKEEDKSLVRQCKNDYPVILLNNKVAEEIYAYTDSAGGSSEIYISNRKKEKLLGVCPSISLSRIEELMSSYDSVDKCKELHSEILRWEAVNSTFGITKEYPKLLGESGEFYIDAYNKGLDPELFR